MRTSGLVILGLLSIFAGCGPLVITTPMPPVANEETQAAINKSWAEAFTPADRLDRQGLLDVLIGTTAYQLAVDRFTYVAEKQFAGGKAVMEIAVDRSAPETDRFDITVYDEAGAVVRQEHYDREFVERTIKELNDISQPVPTGEPETPELAALRTERAARWERIKEFFPEDEPPPDDAEAPPQP